MPPHDTEAGSAPDFSTTNRSLYCVRRGVFGHEAYTHTHCYTKCVHSLTLISTCISGISLFYNLARKSFDIMKALNVKLPCHWWNLCLNNNNNNMTIYRTTVFVTIVYSIIFYYV